MLLTPAAVCTEDLAPPVTSGTTQVTAREALEAELLSLCTAGRTVHVSFSGGRDSSALLCLLVVVCRRHGLPAPVPVVQRWDHPSTRADEEHQDFLLSHLGLSAEVVPMTPDDTEVLGRRMQEALVEHGVTSPWRMHTRTGLLEVARGGTLIDGEGGDEVFGPTRTRVLFHLRRGLRSPRVLARVLAAELGPRWWRRRLARRLTDGVDWFTPAGVEEVWLPLQRELLDRPLHAGAAIRAEASWPAKVAGHRAIAEHCARHDVVKASPLFAAAFVDALAREAGPLGWRDRTTATSRIFSDVLPDHVLRRRDKVDFSAVVWGERTRTWLTSTWDRRSGIDRRWVRPEALARHWAGEHPHPGTALMAQAAWLEQEVGRAPLEG